MNLYFRNELSMTNFFLLLLPPESELQVVEEQAPVTNDPNYDEILKACSADGDCKCFWFWQHPKCRDGHCKCE